MSQSIDTKIVELKFNNDNFADKVDSTLTKLQQLNKDIKEVGLKDALQNWNKGLKDFDISPVTKGVEEATKGFSKMEVAGITAVANIANSVVNLGKKLVSNLLQPLTQGIIQGGLSRARNIEQATFSFEGQKIGKSAGNESLTYYKEVMDAVLGTSYSYDVAAKAASQFAASNIGVVESEKKLADGTTQVVKTLDPTSSGHQSTMTAALLGVAGVASMTGRSFEDVSRVFTKIAGNNRVYAQDLQSFSAMGLNAAAVLASAMETTEEEIYAMVKSGDIHFQEFSDAMNKAFGQHAKDSTLMFQGALDDVNAALARIGADFYGPALNAGRDILNSITPLVDAIHTKLNPALDKTNGLMGKASVALSRYLDMFSYLIEMYPDMDRTKMGDWISEHLNAWTNIADLYGRGDIKKAIKELKTTSRSFRDMDGQEGIGGYTMLGDYLNISRDTELLKKYKDVIGKTDEEIEKLAEDGSLSMKQLRKVINAMVDDGTIGFNTFYKAFHKLWSESDNLMGMANINEDFNNYIRTCIAAEDPTERFNEHLKTFKTIVDGVLSLVKSFSTILGGLGDIFLTIASHLSPLGHMLVEAAKQLAEFVVTAADFIATSESFSTIIDGIVGIIKKIFELINVSKIAEYVLYGIGAAFQFLWMVIEKIQQGFAFIVEKVRAGCTFIVDRLKEIFSSSEDLLNLINSIKSAGIVVFLLNIANTLAKPAVLFAELIQSVRNLSKGIGDIFSKIGEVFKSISGLFGKIGGVLDELTDALKRMQQLIVATAILEIAIAIAVLAGAIYALSKVDVATAAANTGDIVGLLVTITAVLTKLSGMGGFSVGIFSVSKGTELTTVAKSFVLMATSIWIMAQALYKLGQLDKEAILRAGVAVEALLVTMALIAKFLSGENMTYKTKGLKSLWSGESIKTTKTMTKGLLGMVAIAEAVKIVAKALAELATVSDPASLYLALGAIEALMWSMAAISKWLSSEDSSKLTKGMGGLIAMALAVRLLKEPIMELSGIASADPNALAGGVIAILSIMGTMAAVMKGLSGSEGLIKAAAAMVVMALAIKMVANVFQTLSGITNVADAILLYIVLLGGMVIALEMINPESVLDKAIALLAIAEAMSILSNAVASLGEDGEKTLAGLTSLVVLLGVLAVAIWVFSEAPVWGIIQLFAVLAMGIVTIAAFGAAIGVLGVGLGVLGVGLTVLAAGLAALTPVLGTFIGVVIAVGVAIGILSSVGLGAVAVVLALSVAFLLFGVGVMMVGTGISETAAGIKTLVEIKDELKETVTSLVDFVKNLKKIKSDATEVGESFKAISDPLESIKTSAETVTEQMEKLISAYSELVQSSSDCITQMADSLVTISNLNAESFGTASQAVQDFIKSLADISTDATTVATTCTDIKNSLLELKESFATVKEVITDFKNRTLKTFENIGSSLASIAEPLQTLKDLDDHLDTLASDILNFVTNLGQMQEKADAVSESSTKIAEALKEAGDAANVARDGFKGLTKTTANILTQMGIALNNIAKGFSKLIDIKSQLPEAQEAISEFFNKLIGLSDISADIARGVKQVSSAVKTLGKAAAKTASLSKEGMTSSGQKMVDGLIKGIGNKKGEVESKITTILNDAAAKVRGKWQSWYDIGAYLIGGFVAGLISKRTVVEAEVIALELLAERAVKAQAKVKSPSRVWMEIGGYLGEGLAIGIANSSTEVVSASRGLASASEMAVSSAIDAISDAIANEMDTSPVITPVVDLTNVRNSAAFVSSAFGTDLMGVRGTGLAASINHVIQNGSKSGVEKSINNLADQIGTMTDTMNSRSLNNYINIDGATDPEAFADGLIRSFRLNARTV